MRIWLPALAAALLCLAFGGGGAAAAGSAPSAAVRIELPAKQRQQMVDDIANAVIKKLRQHPLPAAAPPPPQPQTMAPDTSLMRSGDMLTRGAFTIAAGFPELGARLADLRAVLFGAAARGAFGLRLGWLLLITLVVAFVAQQAVLRLLGERRRRIARETAGVRRGLRLTMTDIAGVGAFAVAAMALAHRWFHGAAPGAHAALTILEAALLWRIWMIAVENMLRPDLPGARHVPLDDRAARRARLTVSALVLPTQLALWAALGLRGPAAILCASLAMLLFALALLRLRRVVAWLILGRFRSDPAQAGIIRDVLSRHWYGLALIVLVALYATFLVAAVLGDLAYFGALVRTLELVLVLWGIEALCAKELGQLHMRAETSGEDLIAAVIGLRILRALARTAAVTLIAYLWLVRTMLPVYGLDMRGLGHSIVLAGFTLFGAYVLWELLRTVIERHLGASLPRRPGEGDEPARARSRLVTILPLLRIGVAAALFTVTGLVVASQLGIDTAPLIAGAGVLGLAISFGSQSLVRDIVSGIFFIADDAFRVGEYVDTGRLKGTVEGMTVRSLRLRHQNGQLHTIPFGQLGAVTNFSRDWATVKFNLRLARDTDLEQLRRTVKKIGLEMMQNPELASQIIEPLKLQGLAEVADNALIVRLKFTALPANTSWVQRTYLACLYDRLPRAGIGFANNIVPVEAVGPLPEPLPAAAGAAAALSVVPTQAEAAAV